jgi:hypothetical protein
MADLGKHLTYRASYFGESTVRDGRIDGATGLYPDAFISNLRRIAHDSGFFWDVAVYDEQYWFGMRQVAHIRRRSGSALYDVPASGFGVLRPALTTSFDVGTRAAAIHLLSNCIGAVRLSYLEKLASQHATD